jgi:hypothetical protein
LVNRYFRRPADQIGIGGLFALGQAPLLSESYKKAVTHGFAMRLCLTWRPALLKISAMLRYTALVAVLHTTVAWSMGSAGSSYTAPTVSTKNGTYAGVYSPSYQQEFFLGVPFAQPPVGDLRFRVPQPLNASWTGVRNATAYSAYCPGYENDAVNYEGDEDCLTINVVRPIGYEGQKLPVATWIFGGGFFAVWLS